MGKANLDDGVRAVLFYVKVVKSAQEIKCSLLGYRATLM
jgi:hypothetical protein